MMAKTLQIIYWGLPTLTFLLNLIILAILVLSKKDNSIKTFMLMVISMIVWSFASLMMKLDVNPGTLFWNRVMVGGMMMIPLSAYIFFTVFIRRNHRNSVFFWSFVTLSMQVINALGYTTIRANMVQIAQAPFIELDYQLGFGAYSSYVVIFGLLMTCLYVAGREVRRSERISEGLSQVVMALFIIFLGIGANLVPVIGKYPIDFFTGSIAAIFIMRAIYSNRILELRFVITKALVFTVLFFVITLGSAVALNSLLPLYDSLNAFIDARILVVLFAFGALLLFQPLFNFLYAFVNRFFYKEEKRREDLISGFAESIANNLDLSAVTDEMMRVIADIAQTNRNYLFLKDPDSGRLVFTASGIRLDRPHFEFEATHPFLQWFNFSPDPIFSRDLDTHPFFKSMWDKDRFSLNAILFEAALPLKSNNELIGLLLLCHENVHAIHEVDHLEQVTLITATASIAIANALMFEQARHEAITDALTSTYNRRYFLERLAQESQNCRGTMALVLVAIDTFTVYNDIYGHVSGDTALFKIGERIRRIVGDQAIVCRYAGDVFALIVPDMDTKKTYDLAEKVRSQIERTSVSGENEPDRFLTVSIGLCVYPTYASNDVTLLKHTNAAMLEAKRSGRNKTVIYNDEVVDRSNETQVIDENQWATIYALTATIDAKDHITFGHSQRVAKYATAIARAMGAKETEIEQIRQASLLHDIGKIGVPETVLTKTTRLSQEEYEVMKRHVDLSVTIIKYLPTFNRVIPSVIGHHERYDGTGYPRQLKGENIPFGARCIAIADAFDAITSDRHYKMNMTIDYAIQELRRNAGSQFDPKMAETFIKLIDNGDIIVEPTRSYSSLSEPAAERLS